LKRCYWQERLEGEPVAALYVGGGDGTSSLLGVTRQLVGEPWLHARPFRYCGSIGPLPLTATASLAFTRLGQALAQEFSLRGLFGVDCILCDDVPWPLEVNPRFPASAELFDLNCDRLVMVEHARAFLHSKPLDERSESCGSTRWAKAILYARQRLNFPTDGPWLANLRDPLRFDAEPWFADIPAAGTAVDAGQPIMTFFNRGGSPEDCEQRLRQTAGDLDRWLFER
jgi:uncharacterized protein